MATGQNIADEARIVLNDGDSGNRRWSDAELLLYINGAQRQIVTLLPQANVVETSMALALGSKQSIPTGGTKFLALFNSEADGETSIRGDAITVVERDALDSIFPDWAFNVLLPDDVTASATKILHVVHDPRSPKTFDVYPRKDNIAISVFVQYAKLPTDLASLASTVGLGDEYINAIVSYVVYRSLTKDARYSVQPDQRMELWNDFRQTLGLKPQIDKGVDPGKGRAGGDENG